MSGLRPYEALLIGTRNAAKFLGTLGQHRRDRGGQTDNLVLLSGISLDWQADVTICGVWFDRHAPDASE